MLQHVCIAWRSNVNIILHLPSQDQNLSLSGGWISVPVLERVRGPGNTDVSELLYTVWCLLVIIGTVRNDIEVLAIPPDLSSQGIHYV